MKSTLDISVEVRCGCGNELRVLDVTDFNPGEITVEVRACDNCVSKDLNALNARVSTLEAEVASIRSNQRTQSTAIAQIFQLVETAKLKISNGNMCPISACGDLNKAAAKLREAWQTLKTAVYEQTAHNK